MVARHPLPCMKTLWIALSAMVLLGAGLGLLSVLNNAQLKNATLEAKAAGLADQNQTLEKAAGAVQAELAQAKAALAQALADLGRVRDQAAKDLVAQRDSLTARQQEAEKARMENQAGAEASQTATATTLVAALGDAQTRLAALQAKYNALAGQNSRLTAQVAQMQAEFVQARDRAVNESTAALRQALAEAQASLAALQAGQPQGAADVQFLIARKVHTSAGQVKTGTVVQNVPASWTVVLQGLQSGTTYPPIAVTETVYNSLAQGQTYAKGNLRGLLP